MDFLLPHATWDDPPVRTQVRTAEYADWLIAIFDRWVADGRPFGVRTFESILSTLTGGRPLTEALGLTPSDLAVVETDGSYEQVDSLKRAYDGAPETGLTVFTDSAGHGGAASGDRRPAAGPERPVRDLPGLPAGQQLRRRPLHPSIPLGHGRFANPSVYCPDLFKLITHIESRLPDALAARQELTNHSISDTSFRELAAGFGGAAAVAQLTEAQRSLQRASSAACIRPAVPPAAVPETIRRPCGTPGRSWPPWTRTNPTSWTRWLGHPYVRAWAVRCLEQLRQSDGRRTARQPARSSPASPEIWGISARSPQWPPSAPHRQPS